MLALKALSVAAAVRHPSLLLLLRLHSQLRQQRRQHALCEASSCSSWQRISATAGIMAAQAVYQHRTSAACAVLQLSLPCCRCCCPSKPAVTPRSTLWSSSVAVCYSCSFEMHRRSAAPLRGVRTRIGVHPRTCMAMRRAGAGGCPSAAVVENAALHHKYMLGQLAALLPRCTQRGSSWRLFTPGFPAWKLGVNTRLRPQGGQGRCPPCLIT